jgi:hypothetical protein
LGKSPWPPNQCPVIYGTADCGRKAEPRRAFFQLIHYAS